MSLPPSLPTHPMNQEPIRSMKTTMVMGFRRTKATATTTMPASIQKMLTMMAIPHVKMTVMMQQRHLSWCHRNLLQQEDENCDPSDDFDQDGDGLICLQKPQTDKTVR